VPSPRVSNKISVSDRWVVVQLTSLAEREKNIKIIERFAKRVLGNHIEIYVPALSERVRDEEETIFYMEGYVFIKFDEDIDFSKLNDTPIFKGALCTRNKDGQMAYNTIEDKILRPVRKGVKELNRSPFKLGDQVKVVKGTYKNLPGKIVIIYEDHERVQIDASMRSKPLLIDFPCSFLEKENFRS